MRELTDTELDQVSGGIVWPTDANGERVMPPGPGCWNWNRVTLQWMPCGQ